MGNQLATQIPLFDTADKPKRMPPTDRSVKPRLTNGSPTCECTMCGLFFTGPDPFDRHQFELSGKCRTPEQMRKLGMVTNEHGVWQRGVSPNKRGAK
jgi:hypothetical protein